MEFRKLQQGEHKKTRRLWECIFTEDTKAFLDYYYSVKAKENEIFVVEKDRNIISMLQLNPYFVRIGQQICAVNYIVAVATDEEFRRRGIMASLLKASMREMYDKHQPFTFLMPAAEAIYHPFGFRFIYDQMQSKINGKEESGKDLKIVAAEEADSAVLAEFANQFLREYQVVAVRNEAYYKSLIAELASESGGIILAKREEKPVGIFCYTKGEKYEIREPLFYEVEDFERAIYELTQNEEEFVKCIGYDCMGDRMKKVPMIMARILNLEKMMKCIGLKEEIDCVLKIQDDVIEDNNAIFHISGNCAYGITSVDKLPESSEVQGELEIGTLTSLIFGYLTLEQIEMREKIVMEDSLKRELKKLIPLSKVFFNEVV